MISNETHSKEWLEKTKKRYKGKDPILIEKIIRALTLVEQLKIKGLDFIFKGGSSLLLLLKEINRFSIDIDIVIPGSPGNLAEIFDAIVDDGLFSRYEEDKRIIGTSVPKAHFKFFYNSVLNISEQNAVVLLDILFEANPYYRTVSLPVESPFTSTESPGIEVTLPDINGILGDKLTAFAPNTTGIPYGKGKSLEIIKQLYDIGKLFDRFDNTETVAKTFKHIGGKELAYRNLEQLNPADILDDIFETAVIIASRGTYKKECFEELMEGIKKIIHYTYSEQYRIEDTMVSAAKAAYLSQLIKTPSSEKTNRFDRGIDLSQLNITHPKFTKFNKIKKYKPEAFFYWYQAINLLEK